jgi:predicted Mrr-cat superfamily restriction endonuclease
MDEHRQAFVLRIAPGTIGDSVQEALKDDQVIIGWSEAPELLDPALDWSRFREILRSHYYSKESSLRKAGNASGHMWRFIREMKPGDLVVVPHGPVFYVAKVRGEAIHDTSRVVHDTAFRRKVTWLNQKQPIPRAFARAALHSRMKTYGTCAYATDLLGEIE